MANDENLLKGEATQFKSGEQAAKAGKKGGIASGKSKRQKKAMKEVIYDAMAGRLNNPEMIDFVQNSGLIKAKNPTGQDMLIASALVKGFENGNWAMVKDIMEMFGENGEDDSRELPFAFHIDPLIITPNFDIVRRDILAGGHSEYLFKGGRGSLKSSFCSIALVELLVNNPDMHAVVLRQVGNTLKDSVYAQVCWAIEKTGLLEQFEIKKSPLEIILKRTGQTIFFRGADEPTKLKSIKTKFGHIGVLWFEELDQFQGEEAVRNIEQSVIRGGDTAWIFKSYNPPKTINSWANQYALTPKETRLTHHSSYLEAPPEWLGKKFIEEAEYLKQIKPEAYDNEYLGNANGTGGSVFDNVELRAITDDEIRQFDPVYRGVDWGWFPDPFQYCAMYYNPAELTLYIFDEYRCNKKSNRQTADILMNEKGVTADDLLICDSAEQKSVGDYRDYGLTARGVEKFPGSVDYSMKWLQSLVKIVIDPARCPATADEFIHYEYERDKEDKVISGYPDANNHAIDAVRYAMWPVWKRRGQ